MCGARTCSSRAGLYTDQAASHIHLARNLVFHTEAAGCYQHFGRNNTYENNVFALAGRGLLWHANFQASEFGPSDLRFIRNVAYTSSPLFESPFNGSWVADANLFWNATPAAPLSPTFPQHEWWRCDTPGAPACLANASLADWAAATGNDGHSIVDDPLFVDAAGLDFRLRSDSPALAQLGFVWFDPLVAGPKGSTSRPGWQMEFLGCVPAAKFGGGGECADPGVPMGATRSGTSHFGCGDVVVYHCTGDFLLHGSTWRMCTGSGWSGKEPSCVAPSHRAL